MCRRVAQGAQPLVFDRNEATFTEKQCLEWVKTITARPEPEVPPDIDEDAGDDTKAAWPQKRLRKLFVRGLAKHTATPVPPARAVKPMAARAR